MAVEEYGADIINDISGGEMDAQMFRTIAQLNVPYILMHMQGTPQTMQDNPQYSDFLREVFLYMAQRVNRLRDMGVKDIILDPGFGVGKTRDGNYESMIYKLLNTTPQEALNGTSVLHTIALLKGANILRVHDVQQAVEAVQLYTKTVQ